MAETDLPEDVIVNILSWLPVKSLIRFTSVSKRFRSIIFSDPEFARSQFKAACQLKTLGRRLLFSTDAPQLESLDLDAPSFGDISSVRKLSFTLKEPVFDVRLLGSCNGLVFVAVVVCDDFKLYIWNPLMGFFKELPQPGLSTLPVYYGVGYLSATDDYKLFAGSYGKEIEMFSLRAHVWKKIQNPGYNRGNNQGTLLHEALHWLNDAEILAFDFAHEELRTLRLPDDDQHGISFGSVGVFEGCLCVCGHLWEASGSIGFWVMREYDVHGSWTKHYKFLYDSEENLYIDSLVMDGITVAKKWSAGRTWLVKIGLKQETEVTEIGMYMTRGTSVNMIPYQESLLWINDESRVLLHCSQQPRLHKNTLEPPE